MKFGELLEPHFFENAYSPGWYWLTIHDRKARKDRACKTICERFGVSTNDLTVFGDNINDIRMFEVAGKAIAVENADDRAKVYADEVIGTNDSDSVVKYILDSV